MKNQKPKEQIKSEIYGLDKLISVYFSDVYKGVFGSEKDEEDNLHKQWASFATQLHIVKEEMIMAGFSSDEAIKLLTEILKGAMK